MEGNQEPKKERIVRIVHNYELLELLGKGELGDTYLARNKDDNKLYMAKKIPKSEVNENCQKRRYFDAEIKILKRLSGHPNIIRFYEIKETAKSYYIINDLANGGGLKGILEKYIKEKGSPFNEEIVQHLMKQICDAIRYIHEKGIVHRNLKLDNILVNFSNPADKENMNLLGAQIKLIDFGCSIDLSFGELAVDFAGTPVNIAPEEEKSYDNKVDIWSLGTICYELLIGHNPFDSMTMEEFIGKVEKGVYSVPSSISKETMNFIKAMLKHDGAKRKSASELLSMPFLTKSVSEFTPLSKQ